MRIRILLLSAISAFFFCFAFLYSAEPLVKFYLNDGSTKQYNLSEIDSLGVIDKQNNYVMRIHYDDTKVANYPTKIIGSIKFEKDDIQRDFLNVYISSYPKSYKISRIDSITFYIDQDQPLSIGSQIWSTMNLNVDRYRNGDSIPEVRDSVTWASLTTGAWCNYNNDPAIGAIYGKLYNWYAVNDPRGLAPTGWHVPTDTEWKELEMCLGMTKAEADLPYNRGTDEGGKLKEAGTIHWESPNTGATNSSGFSALPGGHRFFKNGWYSILGFTGYWWSSTEIISTLSCSRQLSNDYATVYKYSSNKAYGFSVRCIRD